MVMEYLKNRAKDTATKQKTTPPNWASDKNASLKAWQYVEELNKEKALYIKRHSKVTGYLTKKSLRGAQGLG